jgi:hypothetical protein
VRGYPTPFRLLALLTTSTTLTERECQREQNRNSSRACPFWSVCTEGTVEISTPRGPVRASFLRVARFQHSFVPECTLLVRLPNGGGDRTLEMELLWRSGQAHFSGCLQLRAPDMSRLQFTSPSAPGICKASDPSRRVFILSRSAVDVGQWCSGLSF